MAELDDQLSASRDRITEILTRNKPSVSDVSTAMLRAVTGRTSYGEEMNRMKAATLGEQKTLFDVLSGHKKIKQTDRQLGATEQKSAWEKVKFAIDQGNADAKAVGDEIERYVVNDKDRSTVADYLHGLPDKINARNAGAMVSRAVSELASQGKISQKKLAGQETTTYGNWLPSGGKEALTSRRTNKGKVEVLKDGTWHPVESMGSGSFVSQAVQAGSIGDLGPQKKEGITLREQRDIMTNLIKAGNRLRDDVKIEGAEAIGWTGAIERFADTSIAQGKALASRWNDGGMVDKIAKSIEWSPELAAQSAAIRSQVSSMAYGIALMKNGTRPTDEDVRHAMVMIGASGSPDQMLGAIDSLMRESVDNYATRHKTITGEDWDAPEHFRSYRVPVPGSDKPAKLDYINMNDQDLMTYDLKQFKTIEEINAWRAEMKKRGLSGG